jgi:protein-tyrosine-phosphatase
MQEAGIDISNQKPKQFTFEMLDDAERVIIMGCS